MHVEAFSSMPGKIFNVYLAHQCKLYKISRQYSMYLFSLSVQFFFYLFFVSISVLKFKYRLVHLNIQRVFMTNNRLLLKYVIYVQVRVNLNVRVFLQEIGHHVLPLVVVNKFVECCASVVLEDISATQHVGARNLALRETVMKNVHLSGFSAIGDRSNNFNIKQSKITFIHKQCFHEP